jgi:3-hydroxy-9,10-secoandrosta-1,3,5(10)-triene-9,17-dione monooxygenase reductase component
MTDAGIHYENPFMDPPGERSDARRLRGRLALPVTVWTAGDAGGPVGLTVSSLVVADGEPPTVSGLVGETTDLFGVIAQTKAFVIHLLHDGDASLAEIFAGLRPNPGGPFADLDVEASEWGPVIRSHGTRAFCRMTAVADAGYHKLVTGTVERIELEEEPDSPLVYLRGRFRRLAPDSRRPSSD